MSQYRALANTVIMNKKNRLICYDDSLTLVGTGRSAFVFRIASSDKAIKLFFPEFTNIAQEEAEIYKTLNGIRYFPTIHETGLNYIVMDYIEGNTFFECLTRGKHVTSDHLKEVDLALSLASSRGLNPSDIHLRNIIIASNDEIKLIDVARYRQVKVCHQWSHLKKAHQKIYSNPYFLKKIPAPLLNTAAFLYKKGVIPFFRK